MLAGIFGRTYPFKTGREVIAAAAADGFGAMQFNLSCVGLSSLPKTLPPGLLEDLPVLAPTHGVTLSALSGTYNMAHPDVSVRDDAREGFTSVIAAAVEIGAPVVTLCTGSRDPDDMWRAHPDNATIGAWRDMRTELDFALDLAASHGLQLGIEPEPANVVGDATAAARLLAEVGPDAPLGIVLDAANLVGHDLANQHEIMRRAVDLLGERLLLAHAKDMDAAGRVVCPGDGAVDLSTFVQLLKGADFDGALVGHGFDATEGARAGAFLNRLIGAV